MGGRVYRSRTGSFPSGAEPCPRYGLSYSASGLFKTNAFNLVSTVRLREQVHALCPTVQEYTQVCYGGCAHMFVVQSIVGASVTRGPPGDPLGPLLFALCIHPLILSLHAKMPHPPLENALGFRRWDSVGEVGAG
jgi:hypothetical protein